MFRKHVCVANRYERSCLVEAEAVVVLAASKEASSSLRRGRARTEKEA